MTELPQIKEDYQRLMESKIGGGRLQNALRASSIGTACDRFHYYSMTEKRPAHSWQLQSIFELGKVIERDAIKTLREMEYRIDSEQKEFRLEDPLITCHIEGLLQKESAKINKDPWFPFDIKSVASWMFDKLNSAEDFINSTKSYQRNYPVQLLAYMYATGYPNGCLVLVNKQSRIIKPVWFDFEQHSGLLDDSFKRAKRVYKAVKDKVPGERTTDRVLCERCDWKDICLPDLIANGGIGWLDSPELVEKLEERETLKNAADRYADLDEEVKNIVKQSGVGEKVCGNYLINITERNVTRKVPITWDEQKTSYEVVKIVRMGDK